MRRATRFRDEFRFVLVAFKSAGGFNEMLGLLALLPILMCAAHSRSLAANEFIFARPKLHFLART